MTPKGFFAETLPRKITAEKAKTLGGSYQFKVTGENGGNWYVDLTRDSDWIGEGMLDGAKCTVTLSDDTLMKIVAGTMKAPVALMTGKAKVAGNVAQALKLESLLLR